MIDIMAILIYFKETVLESLGFNYSDYNNNFDSVRWVRIEFECLYIKGKW